MSYKLNLFLGHRGWSGRLREYEGYLYSQEAAEEEGVDRAQPDGLSDNVASWWTEYSNPIPEIICVNKRDFSL